MVQLRFDALLLGLVLSFSLLCLAVDAHSRQGQRNHVELAELFKRSAGDDTHGGVGTLGRSHKAGTSGDGNAESGLDAAKTVATGKAGGAHTGLDDWHPFVTKDQHFDGNSPTARKCGKELVNNKDGLLCIGLEVQWFSDEACQTEIGGTVMVRALASQSVPEGFKSFKVLGGSNTLSLMFSKRFDVSRVAANGYSIDPKTLTNNLCMAPPFRTNSARVVTAISISEVENARPWDQTNLPIVEMSRYKSQPGRGGGAHQVLVPTVRANSAWPGARLELYKAEGCSGAKVQLNAVAEDVYGGNRNCVRVPAGYEGFKSVYVREVSPSDVNAIVFSPKFGGSSPRASTADTCGRPSMATSLLVGASHPKPMKDYCFNIHDDSMTGIQYDGAAPPSSQLEGLYLTLLAHALHTPNRARLGGAGTRSSKAKGGH